MITNNKFYLDRTGQGVKNKNFTDFPYFSLTQISQKW